MPIFKVIPLTYQNSLINSTKVAFKDSSCPNFAHRNFQNGLTLIEILVVISIVGIFGSLAAPSMVRSIQNSETKALSARFNVGTHLAQSEAVKRGIQVSIKPIQTSGNKWLEGWNVFADPNGNGNQDLGEELIQTFSINENQLNLTSIDNVFASWIGFLPSGEVKGNGGISGGFEICRPGVVSSPSRNITIQGSGNIIIEEGALTCP